MTRIAIIKPIEKVAAGVGVVMIAISIMGGGVDGGAVAWASVTPLGLGLFVLYRGFTGNSSARNLSTSDLDSHFARGLAGINEALDDPEFQKLVTKHQFY